MQETKLTRNQKLVYEHLNQASGPMTAYSILDALRTEGFRAPTQVYRALDSLRERGMVHKLESLNAFVPCQHDHKGDVGLAAFMICRQCGEVEEFTDPTICHALNEIAQASSFAMSGATLEVRGRCSACCERA